MSDLSLFEPERLVRLGVIPKPTSSVPSVTTRKSTARREVLEPEQIITASASVVPIGDAKYAQELRSLRKPRQLQAWDAFHTVGEIFDPCDYVGRAISMVRLFPCTFDEDGQGIPDDDPTAKAILQDLGRGMERGGMDGLTALMHDLAVQLTVPGEGYLLGTVNDKGENVYDILSISELVLTGSSYQRIRPGMPPEPISPDSFLLRIWRPDPQFGSQAISGVMVVLDEIETLKLLSDQVASTARSRLARSGIVVLASEATKPPPKAGEVDPLTAEIIEHFITPAENPRSAMGVAPYVLRLPKELVKDGINKIEWDRTFDDKDVERIAYAIRRIAQGLDVPPERVLGLGETSNHWSAWHVSKDEWQGYLEPKCRLQVGALSRGWYLPMLERAGLDITNRGLWFDPTDFLVNPNRVQDAKDSWDRGAISYEALRRELGFSEDDKPSEDEWLKWAAIKLGDSTLLVTGQPTMVGGGTTDSLVLPSLPSPAGPENVRELPPAEPAIAASSTNGHGRNGTTLQLAPRKTLVAAANPRMRQMSRALAEIDRRLFRDLTVEANSAVERALEKAGARLRSRIAGNSQRLAYNDMLQGLPNHLVAMKLGRERVHTLGVEEDQLIDTTFARFTDRAKKWIRGAQSAALRVVSRFTPADYDDLEEETSQRNEQHGGAALALLGAGLAAFAASRLYTPEATPPEKGEFDGLLAPKDVIRDAMRVAGGGQVGISPDGFGQSDPALSGVANGVTTADVLAGQNVGIANYLWVWSGSENPYPEHQDLDGVEFTDWEEVAPNFPGDHNNCGCEVSPVYESQEE